MNHKKTAYKKPPRVLDGTYLGMRNGFGLVMDATGQIWFFRFTQSNEGRYDQHQEVCFSPSPSGESRTFTNGKIFPRAINIKAKNKV